MKYLSGLVGRGDLKVHGFQYTDYLFHLLGVAHGQFTVRPDIEAVFKADSYVPAQNGAHRFISERAPSSGYHGEVRR